MRLPQKVRLIRTQIELCITARAQAKAAFGVYITSQKCKKWLYFTLNLNSLKNILWYAIFLWQ